MERGKSRRKYYKLGRGCICVNCYKKETKCRQRWANEIIETWIDKGENYKLTLRCRLCSERIKIFKIKTPKRRVKKTKIPPPKVTWYTPENKFTAPDEKSLDEIIKFLDGEIDTKDTVPELLIEDIEEVLGL